MNWSIEIHREITWDQLEAEQARFFELVLHDPDRACLLISEHKPTYTYGRAASPSDCLLTSEEIERRGVAVRRVSRGGKWTYHGPGQIVVFPILAIEHAGYHLLDIKAFLGTVRDRVSDFLTELGLPPDHAVSGRVESPFGLYVQERKLVSFGVHVHQGINTHGLALYHADQTEPFQAIHPCGVPGERFASLKGLGVDLDWETAARQLAGHLENKGLFRQKPA